MKKKESHEGSKVFVRQRRLILCAAKGNGLLKYSIKAAIFFSQYAQLLSFTAQKILGRDTTKSSFIFFLSQRLKVVRWFLHNFVLRSKT